MGLILLFFNHQKWKEIYSNNCSFYTPEEWNSFGTPNVPVGVWYFTFGMICQLLYIPFMIAMTKPEFIQHSCYKFMFELACIDMVAILCDSIISGIQCITGIHYCNYPVFFYIVGCGSIGCWLGATMTCVLLALDRFFEILFPEIGKVLFGKKAMIFWLSIPPLYMFVYLFYIPAFFNVIHHAFYFDPYFSFYGQNLMFLVINSVIAVVGMGVPYASLCIVITIKSKLFHNANISRLQRVMLLQSMAICVEMFFVAVVYVGNQFFWVPEFITKIEHTTWIMVHGDTPIVYLLLNASLRKKFFQMIHDYTKKTGQQAMNFATSVYPKRVVPQNIGLMTTNVQSSGLNPEIRAGNLSEIQPTSA